METVLAKEQTLGDKILPHVHVLKLILILPWFFSERKKLDITYLTFQTQLVSFFCHPSKGLHSFNFDTQPFKISRLQY
jgi:hypothetical protein